MAKEWTQDDFVKFEEKLADIRVTQIDPKINDAVDLFNHLENSKLASSIADLCLFVVTGELPPIMQEYNARCARLHGEKNMLEKLWACLALRALLTLYENRKVSC